MHAMLLPWSPTSLCAEWDSHSSSFHDLPVTCASRFGKRDAANSRRPSEFAGLASEVHDAPIGASECCGELRQAFRDYRRTIRRESYICRTHTTPRGLPQLSKVPELPTIGPQCCPFRQNYNPAI